MAREILRIEALKRIAQIRQRDREMYREGGSNLQVREDIHFLLTHLDEVLAQMNREAANG